MTDHTSTPQASRSRGAATAANLSDVGAILRGLSVNMSERIQSLWTINLVTKALRLAAGPNDTCVIDEKVIARRTHLSRISVRRVVRAIERQGRIVKADILNSYRLTNLFPIASDYFSEDARRLAMEIAEKWSGELKPADVAILWSIVRYCDSERRATVPHGVLMKDGEWTSISSVIKRTHILAEQHRLKIVLSRSPANTYQLADQSGFLTEDSPAVIDPFQDAAVKRKVSARRVHLVATALRLIAGTDDVCTAPANFIAKLIHASTSIYRSLNVMKAAQWIEEIPNPRRREGHRLANSYRFLQRFPIPPDYFSDDARALAREISGWPGELKPGDIAVLWALARHCDSKRYAMVSPLPLTEDAGFQSDRDGVKRQLWDLEKRRRLDITRSKTASGHWQINGYQLADASGFLPQDSPVTVGPKPVPADALQQKLIEIVLTHVGMGKFWYKQAKDIGKMVDRSGHTVSKHFNRLERESYLKIDRKDPSVGRFLNGYKVIKLPAKVRPSMFPERAAWLETTNRRDERGDIPNVYERTDAAIVELATSADSAGVSTKTTTEEHNVSDFRHSDDFRSVVLNGERFTLTTKEAQVIQMLKEAHDNGMPDLSGETILERIGSGKRLRDVFPNDRRKLYYKLIRSGERRGTYRLNLS